MSKTYAECQRGLASIWFSGAGIIFAFLLLQSIFGKFSGEVDQAWSWFLPTVMPTLALIIGVLVANARAHEGSSDRNTDPFLYKLSLSLSLVYLLVVLLTLLLEPLTRMTILELMDRSNLWLGPFQGLVTGSLGAFFYRTEAVMRK